ncbi:MAG: hypothetical protein QOH86_1999 [Sphingomonadales bacterium]|jgi:hypothetical protein|nr:hypothetical protein [Sphingomonadales bacterium]
MWNRWAPLAALVLAGCGGGEPEIAACEQFTKSGLRSPATYRRAEVKTVDEKVTPEELLSRRGDRPDDPARQLFLDAYKGDNLGVRNVIISYDADNAYGTPIRGQQICMFQLRNGQLTDDEKALQSRVKSAEADRDFRALARSGGLPNQGPLDVPDKPCCL